MYVGTGVAFLGSCELAVPWPEVRRSTSTAAELPSSLAGGDVLGCWLLLLLFHLFNPYLRLLPLLRQTGECNTHFKTAGVVKVLNAFLKCVRSNQVYSRIESKFIWFSGTKYSPPTLRRISPGKIISETIENGNGLGNDGNGNGNGRQQIFSTGNGNNSIFVVVSNGDEFSTDREISARSVDFVHQFDPYPFPPEVFVSRKNTEEFFILASLIK